LTQNYSFSQTFILKLVLLKMSSNKNLSLF
jgi:hypothetical protein